MVVTAATLLGSVTTILPQPMVKKALRESTRRKPRSSASMARGAASLPSFGAIKRFSREILVMELGVASKDPLWWSHVQITFDVVDHPDYRSGVGALPLVVSLMICNLQVTEMLVGGGTCLNLISVKLMEKLQISKKVPTPTGALRGAIPASPNRWGRCCRPSPSARAITTRRRTSCSTSPRFRCPETIC
jgi:hypothetical protein